jgi:hypothetical protein
MQDRTKAVLVLAAKASRERFGQGIANRVGMAQAFALDDLNGVIALFERG